MKSRRGEVGVQSVNRLMYYCVTRPMFSRRSLTRPVSVAHQNDKLVINIHWPSPHAFYIWNFIFVICISGFLCRAFAPAFFRVKSARDLLILLPFPLFFCFGLAFFLRMTFWVAFGVEEIVVNSDPICWVRKALWWKRKFEAHLSEISQITVKIPWHEASGSVRFTARGRTYAMGDGVSAVDASHIADELGRAISALH
jgi:hypothetical protein